MNVSAESSKIRSKCSRTKTEIIITQDVKKHIINLAELGSRICFRFQNKSELYKILSILITRKLTQGIVMQFQGARTAQ